MLENVSPDYTANKIEFQLFDGWREMQWKAKRHAGSKLQNVEEKDKQEFSVMRLDPKHSSNNHFSGIHQAQDVEEKREL